MTLALRDMFASIAQSGATEDPLAVIGRSAVRCLSQVQFAYYCYRGEETGHVAAVREGLCFFMPPPGVERKIVAMLRRLAHGDGVSVLRSDATRPLLPHADRARWSDFTGIALRVSDGTDSDAAVLSLFLSDTFAVTPRHLVWMGLLGDVASSYLARHRAFGRLEDRLLTGNPGARGGMRFLDPELEAWVGSGLKDPRIKFLVGARGSNKSSALYAIRERVLASGVAESRIVTIDCEAASFRRFKTAKDVLGYLAEFPATDRMRYLFIDEIGMIGWHTELLRRLKGLRGWNVWIASSTAHALPSGGSRRGSDVLVRRLWADPDVFRSRQMLEKYWCQIFMRDVVSGVDHPDIRAKEALAAYYSDHLGEVKSLQEIAREMKASGYRSVSRSSIATYRQSLVDAYLIEISEIYDIFEKSVVTSVSGRVFFTDLELRTWRYGGAPESDGVRVALNRLYLRLRRKYDRVYTPRGGDADFVTVEADGKLRLWKLPNGVSDDPADFRVKDRRKGSLR